MSDRPASAVSVRTDVVTTPALVIRVIRFDLDFEIRFRRSITSGNFTANGTCVPCTVFETAGGIVRGTCFVDPADTTQMSYLSLPGVPVVDSDFHQKETQIILDLTESAGSRYGYNFGNTLGNAMIFPMMLTGETNDAGMIECMFEIHSQKGLTWSNAI